MRELNSVKAENLMRTKEFLIFKDRLIEYLRNFVKGLQTNVGIIETIIKSFDETKLFEKTIKDKEEKEEEKKERERSLQKEIREDNEEADSLWKSCEATLDDMEAELEAVPFDEFAFMRDELVKNKNEDYSFEPHTKTFEAYVSKAKEGKRLLEEEKSQNEKYDRILKTFDEYKSRQDDLEKTEKQCDNLFHEEKERLTEEIYVWEKGNVELHLETEVLQNIEREIENYDENKNYFDIKNIAKPAYEKVSGEIFEDNLRTENEIKSLREEIKEKEEELAEWQNKKDPEPERSESVIKNREKLKAEGIEYLNFYKTVDFAANL